jgi:uncharacterized protein YjbI with pentapeptide repeats
MTQSQLRRDYLSLIRHSVKYWNLWRDDHPDTKPDLAGLDFSKENLDGINLSGAHLKDCKFKKPQISVVLVFPQQLWLELI